MQISSADRKQHGKYYTPLPVVRHMVETTLAPLLRDAVPANLRSLRILEPACGDGVFLEEIFRQLCLWYGTALDKSRRPKLPEETDAGGQEPLSVAQRQQIIRDHLFGLDVDGAAIGRARLRLATAAMSDEPTAARERFAVELESNFRCQDALELDPVDRAAKSDGCARLPRRFQAVLERHNPGFDVVVGNPPYVNIRVLSQSVDGGRKKSLQERFTCARGAYDLYVLFLEQSWRLLRDGGRCGFIVPNKIASLDYAGPCRALLSEQTTIHRVTDVADLGVFKNADVYPYILGWQKSRPAPDHQVSIFFPRTVAQLREESEPAQVPQQQLAGGHSWSLHGVLDLESRVALQPLSACGDIHSGTTGFAARRIADGLREHGERDRFEGFDFVVTGNIDPYVVQVGDVRFMKRHFRRPILPDDNSLLSDAKRRLYREPKILIAGMCRRLEAAWDDVGLALGVQVYAISRLREDSWFLLALLNSKLLSHVFRMRFQAKRMAGGYLAINKGPLGQLPVPKITSRSPAATLHAKRQLNDCSKRRVEYQRRLANANKAAERVQLTQQIRDADALIDRQVYQLYDVRRHEVDSIERQWQNW